MPNTQKYIDAVCEARGITHRIKKGTPCEMDGQKGQIVGGNHAANFNVRFDGIKTVYNCHPYYKFKILNPDGSVLWEHKD